MALPVLQLTDFTLRTLRRRLREYGLFRIGLSSPDAIDNALCVELDGPADVVSVDPQSGVILMKESEAADEEQYSTAAVQLEDVAILAGCLHLNKFGRKNEFVRAISHFLVVARPSVAVEQLKSGLTTHGVLQAIVAKPDIMEEAFVYAAKPLDATSVENLFGVTFADKGSNRYTQEKKAHGYWLDFL